MQIRIFIKRILHVPILLVGFFYYSLHAHAQISSSVKTDTLHYNEDNEDDIVFFVSSKICYLEKVPDSVFSYFNKNFSTYKVSFVRIAKDPRNVILIKIGFTKCYEKAFQIKKQLMDDGIPSFEIYALKCNQFIPLEDAKKLTEGKCK